MIDTPQVKQYLHFEEKERLRILYVMDPKLTADDLSWLKNLDTDSPIKPEVPESIAARLVEQGLAIKLVEGGLQLTTLGREQLADSDGTMES